MPRACCILHARELHRERILLWACCMSPTFYLLWLYKHKHTHTPPSCCYQRRVVKPLGGAVFLQEYGGEHVADDGKELQFTPFIKRVG